MQARWRPQYSVAGFTLVELAVVLVLLGILAGFAMPHIDVARSRVDEGIREAAMFLMGARQKAVLEQHDVVVTFDTAQGMAYALEDLNDNGVQDPGETKEGWKLPAGIVFGRGSAPAGPIGTQVVSFTGQVNGLPEVTFYRNGSASEHAGFYLTTTRGSSAAYATDARCLDVERSTGRISAYEYHSPDWQLIF